MELMIAQDVFQLNIIGVCGYLSVPFHVAGTSTGR